MASVFGGLFEGAKGIAFLGLFIAFIAVVLSKLGNTSSLGDDASGIINSTLTAIKEIPDNWLTILILLVVMAAMLYLLFRVFGSNTGR